MHQDNTQDQLRRDLLQSVEKTRSYLAALLESTSKSLYLASKRSLNNTSSSGIPPNVGDNEELHKAFREEVTHLQQLVDQLVRSFVQASQLAEQYQRRIEQRDLEDSTLCQQLSERLNRLSQVSFFFCYSKLAIFVYY
ncbi:uncharacterized protein Gasu_28480 [Galdieria sulphuraria]|uniref:Uncharacterized protein n=1 Tax=Galdieria sulphuraria TaxID=130081 RepID=M2X0J2_GALSU|nr:uncharacterized protein Gasu_28480 [Galdieria sulphuraria]EME29850.1 hypothetical protein Gasu_28480 [Galdieria sulphuraria]|eukprot:XP_005706370.1 hypothetical protein Gasu_28480 [Galdieria sulphuraria]